MSSRSGSKLSRSRDKRPTVTVKTSLSKIRSGKTEGMSLTVILAVSLLPTEESRSCLNPELTIGILPKHEWRESVSSRPQVGRSMRSNRSTAVDSCDVEVELTEVIPLQASFV